MSHFTCTPTFSASSLTNHRPHRPNKTRQIGQRQLATAVSFAPTRAVSGANRACYSRGWLGLERLRSERRSFRFPDTHTLSDGRRAVRSIRAAGDSNTQPMSSLPPSNQSLVRGAMRDDGPSGHTIASRNILLNNFDILLSLGGTRRYVRGESSICADVERRREHHVRLGGPLAQQRVRLQSLVW